MTLMDSDSVPIDNSIDKKPEIKTRVAAGVRDDLLESFVVSECETHPTSVEAWDEAVSQSRDTWLYHRSNMVAIFASAGDPEPIFVECRHDGKLVGGAILTVETKPWRGIVKYRTMRGAFGPSWTSPFVIDGLDAKLAETVFDRLIQACIETARKYRCEDLLLSDSQPSQRCDEDRPWVNRYVASTDWKHFASYYWLLDLRPNIEALWENMSSRHRRVIKAARDKLSVVRGSEFPDGLDALNQLMEAVHSREQTTLAPRAVLAKLWQEVFGTPQGETFFCLQDGKPVSVAAITRQGKIASYLYGGRTDDSMEGAANLSVWSGIEWAKSQGCEWFDLNSMVPQRDRPRLRGISEFKRRFAGQPIVVHGARFELNRTKRATTTFIDLLGSTAKQKLQTLMGKKAASAENEAAKTVIETALPATNWEIVRWSPGPSSPAEWDSVVSNSHDTWLFHRSSIAPILLPPHGGPLTFLELRLNGKLVGGAIVDIVRSSWHGVSKRLVLKAQLGPQPVSPFLAADLDPKLIETAWSKLLESCETFARDNKCVEWIVWDSLQSPYVLQDRGTVSRYCLTTDWPPTLAHHYMLDLRQDMETLFKNVQSRRRTYIRRAREQLKVMTGQEYLPGREQHVALMEAVWKRENVVVVGGENLLKIYDAIYDDEFGQAFFCLEDGKPITFTGVARYRNVASYLHGGRVDETQHGAHALCFWSAVEWAKRKGCEWFDCNAATLERRGRERMRAISEFKRGFGGTLHHVHGAKRICRPLAHAGYECADLWGATVKGLYRKAKRLGREDTMTCDQNMMALYEKDDGTLFGKDDFYAAMRDAGILPGDTCMVHTDILAFGRPKPPDFNDFFAGLEQAFFEAVGSEGTIVMPTFSYSFCKGMPFDPAITPGSVGVLNEHFRRRSDVVRSNHPIFSVAAWGNRATEMVDVDSDSFGSRSVFAHLHRQGGKIVCFGTPFLFTFIHYVEQCYGVPYRYKKKFTGTRVENGVVKEASCEYYVRYLDADVVVDLSRLEAAMRRDDLMAEVKVGEGKILVVDADAVYRTAWQLLDADKFSLLKRPPNIKACHEA